MLTSKQMNFIGMITWVYLKYGQYEKALPLIELQLKSDSTEPSLLKQLAYSYYKSKQYRRALQTCQRLLDRVTNSSSSTHAAKKKFTANPKEYAAIFLLISLCHTHLNNPQAARKAYRHFINSRCNV